MDRRRFLGSVAGTGAAALAGCAGGEDAESKDSDGVSDSEDYAPKDPDVQSKSDLRTATTIARTTTADAEPIVDGTTESTVTTAARSTATATAATTATDSADANELTAGDGWSRNESHVTAYSVRSVTALVVPDGPNVAGRFDGQSAKLVAFAHRYPRAESVAVGASDPVVLDETTTLTASVDPSDADVAPDERLHYVAFLAPGDVGVDELEADDVAFFHETDPFVAGGDGTIERSPPPSALADDSGDGYSREAVEGAYRLSFDGSTEGERWACSFYVYKSSYTEAVEEPRGRSRSEYVAHAQQEGFAAELAGLLADEAEANDFTDKRMQVEFVVDFVQNLPYVPDDVSKGFDDYTKFITETVVEAGGDCEDTAVMLAAVLQAEPFGYDTVLIQPPGHMAVGIYGKDDMPGAYWEYQDRRYYYIETTGTGWGIGDLPDTYRDEKAYVHQV